jgi:hypothetical protein
MQKTVQEAQAGYASRQKELNAIRAQWTEKTEQYKQWLKKWKEKVKYDERVN